MEHFGGSFVLRTLSISLSLCKKYDEVIGIFHVFGRLWSDLVRWFLIPHRHKATICQAVVT